MSGAVNTRNVLSAAAPSTGWIGKPVAWRYSAAVSGTRSCSSSALARNCGSASKRFCIGWSSSAWASESRLMPW